MHSATDLVLEANRPKLKQGAILVDPADDTTEPKVLFMIDHSVREGTGKSPRTVSRRLQFVALDRQNQPTNSGWAPHLDLVPIDLADESLIADVLQSPWLSNNLEALALEYASRKLVPDHYDEIRKRRERHVDKVLTAVNERLVKEINHWSDRYIKLTEDVAAGRQPRLQPENARRRVEELTARLEQRTRELETMRNVVSSTPVVIGGALVIPQGLLAQRKGETTFCANAVARSRIEQIAMDAVMMAEKNLGHQVFDVSAEKCGWDVTARPPMVDCKLLDDRHIEVKGRTKGATTITVSRNEILYGLNQADKFLLALVLVDEEGQVDGPHYIRKPFSQEPDFGVASSNYELKDLLARAVPAEQTVV
jgi:hypothetical protein